MKIKTLSSKEFDKFAMKHKYSNFYQTSYYGDVMKKHKFEVNYLGFYNNNDDLVGASLILSRKIFFSYKFAYAPNGFLIDYTDVDIISELTNKLKKLLLKQKYIFVKIDPLIKCSEREQDGKISSYNPEINNVIEILSSNGYVHQGFNKFFETLKPRWNAITRLIISNDKLYYELNKQTRNKINKANKHGVEIFKATEEDLPKFYEFVKNKHNRSLSYYQDIFDKFPKDDVQLYLARISPEKFVKNSKNAYEKELNYNEGLYQKIQDKNTSGKDIKKYINKKMASDKLLGQEEARLLYSTRLFQEYPKGIVIGGAIIVKNNDSINLLIEGFDKKFRNFNPNYLLKWELIKHFNETQYKTFNLNAINGEFASRNKYSGLNEMKLGFNAKAVEYIGEFDYIINKPIYKLYQLNILNKTDLEIKERYR